MPQWDHLDKCTLYKKMRFLQSSDSLGPVRCVLVIISITRVQWASYGNWEKPMIQLFWMCAILTRQTEKQYWICLWNSEIFWYIVSCYLHFFWFSIYVVLISLSMSECYRVYRWAHTIAGHCISIRILFTLSRHFLMILWWFLDVSFCLSVPVELLFIADISIIQCHTAVHPTGSNSLDQFKF